MENNARSKWNNLNASTKRSSMLGIVAVVAVVILYVFVSGTDNTSRKRSSHQPLIKDPLTNGTAGLGLEALAARLNSLRQEVDAEKDSRADAEKRAAAQLDEAKKSALKSERSLREDLADSRNDLEELRKELERANVKLQAAAANAASRAVAQAGISTGNGGGSSDAGNATDPHVASPQEWDLFESDAAADVPTPDAAGRVAKDVTPPEPLKIRTYSKPADPAAVSPEIKLRRGAKPPPTIANLQVPAGSIISGPLITGLDAPTGQKAQSQPFPALIRIKRDAILPNDYALDIKDCFILAGGYGDLSSERALLRAERISCVTEEGGVLESTIDAYAVGEDGKVGLRGRLVNRLGGVLANTLLAGFASGAAQAFTPQRVPIISNNAGADPFATISPGRAAGSGLGGGASQALERLADYYLGLAEETFPIIEIDAQRNVEFVLVRGVSLPLPTNRVIKN